MKRRNFIGLIAGATAGVAVGTYLFTESFDELAKKIIIKDTSTLNIDPSELNRFFEDVKKHKVWDRIFPYSHKQLIKWHYYVDNPLFGLPYAVNYKAYRSKMVGTFLLSTDFFLNKMNNAKSIRYRALFDPYQFPCSNPFSNLYYPGA